MTLSLISEVVINLMGISKLPPSELSQILSSAGTTVMGVCSSIEATVIPELVLEITRSLSASFTDQFTVRLSASF